MTKSYVMCNQPAPKSAYQAILRSELSYLKRASHKPRNRLYQIFILIMVTFAVLFFVWAIINVIPQHPSMLLWLLNQLQIDVPNFYMSGGLNHTLTPFTLVFPLCMASWELWLMFHTLAMSANTIIRERTSNNWEQLLLTRVSVSRIIMAKWCAVIRYQLKDYALLAIIRIGITSFLALNFSVDLYSYGSFPYFGYGRVGPTIEPYISLIYASVILIVLLSAVLMAVLTLLALMLTTACGILGAVLAKHTSRAIPYSVGIRFGLMILGVPFALGSGYMILRYGVWNGTPSYYPDPLSGTLYLILGLIGASIVDTGSIAAGLLMRFSYAIRWSATIDDFKWSPLTTDTIRGHGPAFLIALIVSAVLFAVLSYTLTWLATRYIAQQRME